MQALVTGASGFVGNRLCAALADAGHTVRAMTRRPRVYTGIGEPVYGDVGNPESLRAALAGCDVAYYLVHALDDADFARRDADAASEFGTAAAEAGVKRIIYLGGLGDDADSLSPHLRSRRDVEGLLGVGGVPVTTLRAGIVVGHGGISWEMTRQVVEHVPAPLVAPNWVRTRTQPIAVADVVRYLVEVLDVPETAGRAFDIGGSEVLTYQEMLERVAAIEGRIRKIVPVPVLGTLLSPPVSWLWMASRWMGLGLWLVTDIDVQTGRNLIESMNNEVIVRDNSIRELVPFEPMNYDRAVLEALAERAAARRNAS
jgi:uncharacterized protein YbjT (DUF2867 family)